MVGDFNEFCTVVPNPVERLHLKQFIKTYSTSIESNSIECYSLHFVCAIIYQRQMDTTPTPSESGKKRPRAMCEKLIFPSLYKGAV